jgi:hypothetical protein
MIIVEKRENGHSAERLQDIEMGLRLERTRCLSKFSVGVAMSIALQ